MSNSSNRNGLNEMMASPTKQIEQTTGIGGILAALWRKILYDKNYTLSRLEFQLRRWMDTTRVSGDRPSVVSFYNRGNIRRALGAPQMTIKVFIKALRILDIVGLELTVKLTNSHGQTSVHSVEANIGSFELDEDEDDAMIKDGMKSDDKD